MVMTDAKSDVSFPAGQSKSDQSIIICVGADAIQATEADVNAFNRKYNPLWLNGDIHVLADRLEQSNETPDIVIVELSSSIHDIFSSLHRLANCLTEAARVIAIGTINDISFYKDIRHLGLADYFLKPIKIGLLSQFMSDATHQSDRNSGTVIGVTGLAGGVGTSTFAINFAHALSLQTAKTLFIDTAPPHKTFLGGAFKGRHADQSHSGIGHGAKDPETIFEWSSPLKTFQFLSLKSAEPDNDIYDSLNFPARIRDEMLSLRAAGHQIILDLADDRLSDHVMPICDHLVIVAEPDFRCLSVSHQFLAHINVRYPLLKPRFILNRFNLPNRIEFRAPDFTRIISSNVNYGYRFDSAAASKSLDGVLPLLPHGLLQNRNLFFELAAEFAILIPSAVSTKYNILERIRSVFSTRLNRIGSS